MKTLFKQTAVGRICLNTDFDWTWLAVYPGGQRAESRTSFLETIRRRC